jgi:hypothetical protein
MKKIKILLLLWLSFVLTDNTFASTIDNIKVIDNNTIEMTASNDVNFSDTYIEWDIKVLKDIPVSYSSKDVNNAKKILLNLWDDLIANNSYSLISILWVDWNIDFTIWDYLKGEIINEWLEEWDEWIEKINIIDSRTIELYFTSDVENDTFEFKILSEVPTVKLISNWNNIIDLEIKENLEKNMDYILMILALEDKDWNKLVFDEDLYDFSTSNDLVIDNEEKEVVLASAKDEKIEDEWNINVVASSIKEIPETWATTWFLVLLTIILNVFFFLRKKILI